MGGLLASARSPLRENSCQLFSNNLRPLRYHLPFQKQSSEVLGLRVIEVKTIKYRFCRSEVPRCEKIKHGLPCDDFRHKSGRGKRTCRVSQRLLVGKASVIRPKRKKRTLFSSVLRFIADYVSRQKQLSVVFGVANAQKQEVIEARLVLASSTTMFQALEPENPKGSWRVYAPILPIEMKKADLSVCYFYWSGLRGSNPPPPPWQGGALPNELNPRKWCLRSESNQRHRDFQSLALPTELQRHIGWRLGWGSNPRPLA